jgi:hypothetical protein
MHPLIQLKRETMKTIAIATLVLAAVWAFSVSLNGCGTTKTKTVSAATIAQLPPGKPFEIDLTRSGTVYNFNDAGTDFSRVTVRTSAGVKTFARLLKASNTSVRAGLVLGRPDDMRDHLPPLGGGTTNYDCGVFCKCTGQADCISLILSGKCGDDYWCSSSTDNCFCTAKP